LLVGGFTFIAFKPRSLEKNLENIIGTPLWTNGLITFKETVFLTFVIA